jgi:GTP cyclohydrolase I
MRLRHWGKDELLIRQLLQALGEDPDREGLVETPRRMLDALREMTNGCEVEIKNLFKTFDSCRYDEMIIVRDIPVTSLCEHHLLPFTGVAHIGYIPDDRILGLSKFHRLVDALARRLQVQERLTRQIMCEINAHMKPKGVGVVLECRHSCMELRGSRCQGAMTVTSSLCGSIRNEHDCRAEFMRLIK